jgi:hypothetical protein
VWIQYVVGIAAGLGILATVIKVGMILGRIETTLIEIKDELQDTSDDYKQLNGRVAKLERERELPSRRTGMRR